VTRNAASVWFAVGRLAVPAFQAMNMPRPCMLGVHKERMYAMHCAGSDGGPRRLCSPCVPPIQSLYAEAINLELAASEGGQNQLR
jgi:hypothetical protein